MKKIKTGLAASVLASALTMQVSADDKICHIANAGFLFEKADRGVLVDAVMQRDDYEKTFALPSPETLSAMEAGTGAFSNVKLVLVTHKHGDHFDAAASLRHIRADADVEYVMPPEAFDLMKSAGMTTEEAKRVHAPLPDWTDGPALLEKDGIKLETYRVDHGPDMPQNLGYRVTIAGTSFFHTGDINASPERLKNAGLSSVPVDYMMMPFWYALQQKASAESAWTIGTMIATHYHAKEQPWMERMGGPEGLRTAAAAAWPNSIRIDKEMQCEKLG